MTHPTFLRVAYLGTRFHGWQIQTSLRTVQGELWRALQRLDPDVPMPQGTGRTDSGVHARAQGALALLARLWDPYRLLAAVNAHLPPDVRVLWTRPAPEGFFPRQHAVAKRYVYRIFQGPVEDPFTRGLGWHIHKAAPLDEGAMVEGCRHLVGEHDFSSFRHRECVAAHPTRHIYKVEVVPQGSSLDLVFEGNRFLMHQVRIMSGTLVEVGLGRRKAASVLETLAARDRRTAGITAPPAGLFLDEIWYQSRWSLGEISPWAEPSDGIGPA
jgi:tRNA pseudouridine38-40 synthase